MTTTEKIWVTNFEDHFVKVVTAPVSYLEVELTYPPLPPSVLNVPQNTTFWVNTTVTCRGGGCGNVNGTVRYNSSSADPDKAINTTKGAIPFYIIYPTTSIGGEEQILPTYAENSTQDVTDEVNTTNDVYATESCTGAPCSTNPIYINFTTSDTYDSVTIEWKVSNTDADANAALYCWDGSSWGTEIATTQSGTDVNNTASLSSCSNSDGNYTFKVLGATVFVDDQTIYVDFVFINRTNTTGQNPQSCGQMNQDDVCNVTWLVNTTGNVNTDWKIGVLFNSTQSGVEDNHTDNATIRIVISQPLITLWSPGTIDFGSPIPNTYWNNATNNTDNFYNISVDPSSCTVDIWVKGTDLENTTLETKISVGNVTWNNYFNWTISTNMSMSYTLVNASIPENTNVTTYYWLNLPPVYAGKYNGTVTVCANCTSGGDPCG